MGHIQFLLYFSRDKDKCSTTCMLYARQESIIERDTKDTDSYHNYTYNCRIHWQRDCPRDLVLFERGSNEIFKPSLHLCIYSTGQNCGTTYFSIIA